MMKNKLFKILALAVVSIMAMVCLTSCSSFTCDGCKEEKTGKSYSVSDATLCEDCYEDLEELKNQLN